jgi:hypothetical protein
LQGARSVGWQTEAHADAALENLQALLEAGEAGLAQPRATPYAEPLLFEPVEPYCASFSQWWRQTRIAL